MHFYQVYFSHKTTRSKRKSV